jgi:uncharacterized protein with von Willebrand factor type A (vWA) domain
MSALLRIAALAVALVAAWGCDQPAAPAGGNSVASGRDDKVSVSPHLIARNYYVVFDASGSMKDVACSGSLPKIDAARNALAAFADSVPADANLALQVFDDSGVNEWLPLASGNRDRFRQALTRVRAGGGTPLRSAIELGYQRLAAQGAKQLGYGEYHLVVVTDGEASPGQNPVAVVDEMLKRSPVVLHTIGFCISGEHSLNQPGRTLYRAADNPAQLRERLGEVLAEAPAFDAARFK